MRENNNQNLKFAKTLRTKTLSSFKKIFVSSYSFLPSILHSPFSILRLPLTILRSLFTVHRLPFTAYRSLIILTLTLALTLTHSSLFAQTKNIKIQSYHISPVDSYKHIRIMPRSSADIGDFDDPCNDNEHGILQTADDGKNFFCYNEYLIPLPGIWQQNQNDIFLTDETDQYIGIGTDTPEFKLTLENNGGILANGQDRCPLNSNFSQYGDIANADYSMLLWYPQKGAFLAIHTNNADAGMQESDIGYYSTALGDQTIASGIASFTGGSQNTVSGPFSTILGGYNNTSWTKTPMTVCDRYAILGSHILGGNGNQINRLAGNLISGGQNNNITNASSSAIMGGRGNEIDEGQTEPEETLDYVDSTNVDSTTLRTHSLIIGGYLNKITDNTRSAIGGGTTSQISATSNYAGILGGVNNTIESSSNHSIITGGKSNSIALNGAFSSIGGGEDNAISKDHPIILSGSGHTVVEQHSSIAGGSNSTVSGQYSSIGNGENNNLSGNYSMMGAGYESTLSGNYSMMFSGESSSLSGNYSMSAGTDNNCSSSYSTCYSNVTDSADGEFSWFFGGSETITNNNSATRNFIWNDSEAITTSTKDTVILFPNRVGIGTDNPQKTLDVNGTMRVQTISINTISTVGSLNKLKISATNLLSLDLAEQIETTEPVGPGDVLVINKAFPNKASKNTMAYDKSVIGVVSSAPALLFSSKGIVTGPDRTPELTQTPPIALTGRVPIKVSTENGPIEPGDLLTSSSTPGIAMKATDINRSIHAVIGKALEPFNDTDSPGKILAIITLR